MGRYSVEQRSLALPLLSAAFLSVLAMRVFAHIAAPSLSTDGWRIWSLAQSIPEHFFQSPFLRSFAAPSDRSAAFPLLWPSILAGVAWLTGLGPRAGLVAASAAFVAFAAASEALGHVAFQARWIGLAAAAALLSDNVFVSEFSGGGPMSMHLLLMASAGIGIASPSRFSDGRAFAVGLLAGLAALNRFDALTFAAVAVLATGLAAGSVRAAALCLIGLLIGFSPWIIYSVAAFGVPLATDNGGVVLQTNPYAHVSDWHRVPPKTAFDDPVGYGFKLMLNVLRFVRSYALSWMTFPPPYVGPTVLLLLTLGVALRALVRRARTRRPSWRELSSSRPLLFGAAVPGGSITHVVVGYLDQRYTIPLRWLAVLLASGVAARAVAPEWRSRFGAGMAALMLVFATWAGDTAIAAAAQAGRLWPAPGFGDGTKFAPLLACLPDDGHTVLFLEGHLAAEFAGTTGRRATFPPRNLEALPLSERRRFIDRFDVRTVVADQPVADGLIERLFVAEFTRACAGVRLFRVAAQP